MKTNKEFDKIVAKNKALQKRLEALAGIKGLRAKLVAELETKKNAQNKNFPVSNSNILQVKEFLKNWLDDGNADLVNLRLQMMWSKIRYFQNLLTFANDDFLEFYGHRLCQTMIVGGAVAVAEFNSGSDDPLKSRVLIPVSPETGDINGNIVSAKTYCAPFMAGLLAKTDYDQKNFDNKIITEQGIKGNSLVNKACFFKWESVGLTYLWMLLPFISVLIKIINMLQLNIGAGMFKYLYRFEGAYSDAIVEEIKALTSPYSNVVLMAQDPTDGAQRKDISAIRGDNKTPPNVFTQQDLAHFMNLMAYFTGEFTNLSEKTSERNINAEVTVNASYFSISQQEFLREAKLGVYWYNKTFDANATVRFTYDVQQESGIENDENQDIDYQAENGGVVKPK